jgi:hypothetical protein
MFLCLFGSRVAVRLGEAERNDLLDGKGARKAVARSLAYARTLPPKVKK